jgi:hypothetical protein
METEKILMMIRTIIITTCLSLIFLASGCNEDSKPSKSGYIIFGHFYGECLGEKCIEIFRLEEDKLFQDSKDRYPSSSGFYSGKWVKLSNQKFNDTRDLINDFPMDLLTETSIVIGQPDAGDWGGLYIEYNFDGIRKFWLVDQKKSNVPAKYHLFIDKVNEKINQLQ